MRTRLPVLGLLLAVPLLALAGCGPTPEERADAARVAERVQAKSDDVAAKAALVKRTAAVPDWGKEVPFGAFSIQYLNAIRKVGDKPIALTLGLTDLRERHGRTELVGVGRDMDSSETCQAMLTVTPAQRQELLELGSLANIYAAVRISDAARIILGASVFDGGSDEAHITVDDPDISRIAFRGVLVDFVPLKQ